VPNIAQMITFLHRSSQSGIIPEADIRETIQGKTVIQDLGVARRFYLTYAR